MRMVLRSAALVLALAFPALTRGAGQAPPAAPDARFEKIASLIRAQMVALAVPGVAFGVLEDGRVTIRAFGVTNVDHPLPVTDDTLFQIGSISKTFTGTAMMRLAEQGEVDLSAPIQKYLPEFRVKDAEASARATVQDTLTHMGGWEGDFFADPGNGDDALQLQVKSMATLEQTAKPGEMWGYNNAGFYAAGRIIEVIAKQPFEVAVKNLVFEPVGLENVYFFPADVMVKRFVVGHAAPPNRLRVIGPWPLPRAAHAAGGVTTNVATLLKYAAFHMGDGTSASGQRVLQAATLQRMRSAIVPKAGTDLTMGLTWHNGRAGAIEFAEHGGSTNGQQAQLRLVPGRRFAFAIVTNSGSGGALNGAVSRAIMETYLGVPDVLPERMTVNAAALTEYEGTYRRQFSDIVVTADGDALNLETRPKMPGLDGRVSPIGPPQRLGFYAKDKLLRLDGPLQGTPAGEFVRSADGKVAWLRMSRILRRIGAGAS
jgi:CubicO group peptidase (beta-lactamase class C family)